MESVSNFQIKYGKLNIEYFEVLFLNKDILFIVLDYIRYMYVVIIIDLFVGYVDY